jgi:hypothetical protein
VETVICVLPGEITSDMLSNCLVVRFGSRSIDPIWISVDGSSAYVGVDRSESTAAEVFETDWDGINYPRVHTMIVIQYRLRWLARQIVAELCKCFGDHFVDTNCWKVLPSSEFVRTFDETFGGTPSSSDD